MRFQFLVCCIVFADVVLGSIQHLTGRFGTLKTPNYPKPYEDNVVLKWHIKVDPGFLIKIQFTDFDLEDSYEEEKGSCVYDYLKITEGNETLSRFCGSKNTYPFDAPKIHQWIYTKGNEVWLEFVSDYSNNGTDYRGFYAHFIEADINECRQMKVKEATTFEDWDKLVTCNHFCHNTPGSYYCSCRNGFTLHSNKHTCVATYCKDVVLTNEEGLIKSPDYPNAYAKLSDCNWTIKVRVGLSILMTFNKDFEIEEHDEEGCVYDVLKVSYNGTSDRYCGKNAPNSGKQMDMNTREVQLNFHTDLALEYKGFKLTYTTSRIRCLKKLNDPQHGNIVKVPKKGYYEFEDVVAFSCDRGYYLKGSAELKCQNDGTWDDEQPVCEIKKCEIPLELLGVANSEIENYKKTTLTYGEVITVKCNTWYEMVSGAAQWRCAESKKWVRHSQKMSTKDTNELPQCKPICGIKGGKDRPLLSQHIHQGTKSYLHEWPWMVFLNFGPDRKLDASGWICAGALISPNFVLTAAHCLKYNEGKSTRSAKETHVWLGVHDRDNMTNVEYVAAAENFIHPDYGKHSTWDYDVALIRLSKTIIMSKNIRTVCLPSTPDDYQLAEPKEFGEVAGWGLVDLFRASMILYQVEFPIVDHKTCWDHFKLTTVQENSRLPDNLKLTESMFCAGRPVRRQSTCKGDSGSPFVMQKKKTSKYYSVGLVSFGIGACGKSFTYSGYAKLTEKIVTWIMKTTNNLD